MDEAVTLLEATAIGFEFGGFYEETSAKQDAIVFRCQVCEEWECSIILNNGERFASLPFSFRLFGGEPILGNKQRLQGGGGILSYIPKVVDADFGVRPSEISGWVAFEHTSFARLWNLLSSNGHLVVRATMGIRPVRFGLPDEIHWDVEKHPHLTIRSLSVHAGPKSWYEGS